MRYSQIARVIFVMAVCSIDKAQAGWFGGNDKDEPKEKTRAERRAEREGGERARNEPEAQFEGGYTDPYANSDQIDNEKKRRTQAERQQYKDEVDNLSEDVKEKRAEMREMRKNKAARSKDEMMSKEFNQKMMKDEELEETHTPEENLDGYLTDEDINRIWSEHMHDFVPEDMSNVVVESKSTEALFEWIGHEEPTSVKGAYYVLGGNADKTISCIVYDANREIVYKRKGSAQGILLFDTTGPGEYAIIFSNMQSGQDLTVTLALHTYEEQEEAIKYDVLSDGSRVQIAGPGMADEFGATQMDEQTKIDILGEDNLAASDEHIQAVRGLLREIQVSSKQVQSEAKLSMLRQNGHNEDLLENSDWNFYFMLLEVVCFGLIVTFQTHHIKKLLDNKLII